MFIAHADITYNMCMVRERTHLKGSNRLHVEIWGTCGKVVYYDVEIYAHIDIH